MKIKNFLILLISCFLIGFGLPILYKNYVIGGLMGFTGFLLYGIALVNAQREDS